ncbi:conserved hypothetical protein [Bradyrhizobium sp. STM 3843]|uniref:hypothetical protein n=1 Tax=Bradyrhizobium sp. STM 3843 TaxID=551947 RepID=UPI00024037E0|nr:hypothetical protein [Bradyrhizobium sp. STM 3843]CCE09011.1 conserved hypothetical protein [Bradyrhizobium sp. STM 3843]
MPQPQERKSPFDKEPAEGSRETVDQQLREQEQETERGTADPVTVPDPKNQTS